MRSDPGAQQRLLYFVPAIVVALLSNTLLTVNTRPLRERILRWGVLPELCARVDAAFASVVTALTLPEWVGWPVRISLLFITLVLASLYTRLLVHRVPFRRRRVLYFMPVVLFLTLLPNTLFLRESHIITIGFATCVASWWSAHKALSFLLDYRKMPEGDSIFSFCMMIMLPVRLARTEESRQGVVVPLTRALCYLGALSAVSAWLLPAVAAAWWPLQSFYRGLIMFATAAFVSDMCAAFAECLGVGTEEAFRQPWLAASLSEFWSQRWNLPASDVLRDSVYYPAVDLLVVFGAFGASHGQKIVSARDRRAAIKQVPEAARLLATLLTFLVSGIMHELIIFCVLGEITGETTTFFALHGVLVALEGVAAHFIERAAGGPIWRRVPLSIRRLVTACILLVTGQTLFFEPMARGEMDVKASRNVLAVYNMMLHAPETFHLFHAV